MLVVAGIFAVAAVRFALIPDRPSDGEARDRSQSRMKQTTGQPVCITGTNAARQLPDPSEVTLVTQLKLAAKRRMRLETQRGE